jgi:hypothetical protein
MYNGGSGLGNFYHPSESGSHNVPAVDFPVIPTFTFGGSGGRGGDSATGSFIGFIGYYIYAGDPSYAIIAAVNNPPDMGGEHGFFTAITGGVMGFRSGTDSIDGSFPLVLSSFHPFGGGAGGSAGACFNSGSVLTPNLKPRSGWGGGGGGVIFIAAREAVINGRVEARGGMGGNTFGKAGGGGGGGGGFIYIVTSNLSTLNQRSHHFVTEGGLPGIGQTVYGNMIGSQSGSNGDFIVYEI